MSPAHRRPVVAERMQRSRFSLKGSMLSSFSWYFVLVSFIPLVALGTIASRLAMDAISSSQAAALDSVLESQSDIIDGLVLQAENLMTSIKDNESINAAITSAEARGGYFSPSVRSTIMHPLSDLLSIKGLSLIRIVTASGAEVDVYEGGASNFSASAQDANADFRIRERLARTDKDTLWLGAEVPAGSSGSNGRIDVVAIFKGVDPANLKRDKADDAAYLLLGFEPESFGRALNSASKSTGASFILIDSQGRIISRTDGTKTGNPVEDALLHLLQGPQNVRHTFQGFPVRVRYTHMRSTGWTIAALLPESIHYARIRDIRNATLGFAVLMILGTLIFTIRVARRWVVPLRSLSEAFSHLGHLGGNFSRLGHFSRPGIPPDQGEDTGNLAKAASYVVSAEDSPGEVRDLMRWFSIFLETERERIRMDQALRESEARLRFEAEFDLLTGLHNRRWLFQTLGDWIKLHQTDETATFAAIFLDLDHFKLINDTRGHHVGDRILVLVAERLRECVGNRGELARLGGDEFIILIKDNRQRIESALVDDIESALLAPASIDDMRFNLSASIGIALCDHAYASPEEVLRDADIAMYRAKAGGRARREVFDNTMREQVFHRMELESELQAAVRMGGLGVYYQPIIRVQDRVCLGFEALARWPHAEFGMVMPGIFIPLAEESSLILEIGRYMVRKAARQVAEWKRQYPDKKFYVSVNLSPFQIRDEQLVEKMVESIRAEGAEPSDLALELTESAFLEDPGLTGQVIDNARAKGFRIFLDDFGSGYSSIGYLKEFHFDSIKIDRQFLAGLGKDQRVARLLKVFSEIARIFDLGVILEGVEEDAQFELLSGTSIDAVQGDYFSRPIKPSEVGAWIESIPSVAE